ncbi:MAG: beta strand repeat-containing protein, partial [Ilumatobacteraceae bacterium]
LGLRSLTLTNLDGGTHEAAGLLTITAKPVATSLTPSTVGQGATAQSLTVAGTGFQSGMTAAVSGTGVTATVSSITATSATLTVAATADALPGLRSLTLTNPDGGAHEATGLLTVTAKPVATSLSPSTVGQGATAQLLTVAGTGFQSGMTASFSGLGVTATVSGVTASSATLSVTVTAGALLGLRSVTLVNTDGGRHVVDGVLTVTAQPTLVSVLPAALGQGTTGRLLQISGTGFQDGIAASFSGTGLTLGAVQFNSSTSISVTVAVADNATTGPRSLTLTNPDGGSIQSAAALAVTARPAASSLTPSTLGQGAASIAVAVNGSGFQAGLTASISGTGVTIQNTVVNSASLVTLTLSAAVDAALTVRSLTLTNSDGGSSTLESALTVTPMPMVDALSPAAAGRGAASALVTVNGSGFQNGITAAFSGTGVTVDAVAVSSSTFVVLTVSVSPTAALVARSLTLVNPDGGVYSAVAALSITEMPATTALAPDLLPQGVAGQLVTVTGSGFQDGATIAFSGAGITVVDTPLFISSTELLATVSIAADAPIGLRNVTVTNADGGSSTRNSAFTVLTGIDITSVTPSSLAQGTTVPVSLAGTGFKPGATVSVSGTGVTLSGTPVIASETLITLSLAVAVDAQIGPRSITVTNADTGTATAVDAITVVARPEVASLTPNVVGQGATARTFTVSGSGFQSGATVTVSGTGLTVGTATFVSPTQLTVGVAADVAATLGPRSVTVLNPDGGTSTTAGALSVNARPVPTSAAPTSLAVGAVARIVTVRGTGFDAAATVAFSGTGITINSVTVLSATEIDVNVTVAANATISSRSITVTNPDGGVGTLLAGFSIVSAATLTVNSITPDTRGQGAGTQTVVITGTAFASTATVAFSGTGVTVTAATVNSATQITATINVAATATVGLRNVTVTNSATSTFTLAGGFTVTAGPTISSLSRTALAQGVSGRQITITGTNFVSGATVAFGGTGVTVSALTFVNSTTLQATVSVAAAAATGLRSVTVTNPDAGAVTLASGLTVNAQPTVTSVTPATVGQGAVSRTHTIAGTGFQAGAVITFSGTGVTINSSTVTATSITLSLSIAADATTGARSVTVTNPDDGAATLATGLTIAAAPTLVSASPLAIGQGAAAQTLTLSGTGFAAGMTFAASTAGITFGTVTVASATSATVPVTIAGTAALGATDLTLTRIDGGSVVLGAAFTVTAGPTVSSVSPSTVGQGAASSILTVSGANFATGAVVTIGGTGVTVNSVTRIDAATLEVSVTVAAAATTGIRAVTVRNPDAGTGSLATGLTVTAAPTLTSVTPASAGQGAVSRSLTVVGTGFQAGITAVFSGAGVT